MIPDPSQRWSNGSSKRPSRYFFVYVSRKNGRPPVRVPDKEYSLVIEKLVHGGYGLARTESGIVFVRGVVAGETVTAVPAELQGGVTVMDVVVVVNESPFRRRPSCPHFGRCGGCDWLHIDHERQIVFKGAIFAEALRRLGGIDRFPEPQVIAAAEFGYRRRAQFKIDGAGQCGFYRRGTNEVVPIDRCPLLTDRLNDLFGAAGRYDCSENGDVRSVKFVDGDETVASDPVLDGLTVFHTTIRCGDVRLSVGGGDFVQGNRYLLKPLADVVAQHCRGETLVDLYGGTGFFSLTVGREFKKGWLVETDKAMVSRASENFAQHGLSSFSAIAAPAEKMEQYIPKHPDVLIVDPPRPGLTRKARAAVVRCCPKKIVYISCDCATQARDAGYFIKGGGYRICASVLVDLYPNTSHTETILVFERE